MWYNIYKLSLFFCSFCDENIISNDSQFFYSNTILHYWIKEGIKFFMLKIYNIIEKQEYLREVAELTQKEWGSPLNTEEEF